jgi:hypothetical protein
MVALIVVVAAGMIAMAVLIAATAVVVIAVSVVAALVAAFSVLGLTAAGRGRRAVLTVRCAAAAAAASRDAPGSSQHAGRSADQQAGYDQDACQA